MDLRTFFCFITASVIFCVGGMSQKGAPVLSARNIEKNMAKVSDSLYACKYETSNIEYQTFLSSLINNDELYNKYRVDSTGWYQVARFCETSFGDYYHRHPAFSDYPVLNINYEGAIEYSKWLTELYNKDPKRKFRKVVFTLPSEKEWTSAAQGGRTNSLYPWGWYYHVNKKGFYMCNFKPVGDPYYTRDSLGNPVITNYNGEAVLHAAEFPTDKTYHAMKIDSFYPNDLGIYNASGNAAEMILTQGYAMGGSWNSYGGEITTISIKQYKYPSPEVGFRVFMKIIQP